MAKFLVYNVLEKYLKDYVKGFSAKTLQMGVLGGDVRLKELHLNESTINELHLPVQLVYGYINWIRVSIPWLALDREPVKLEVDGIYLMMAPIDKEGWDDTKAAKRRLALKRLQIEKAFKAFSQEKKEEAEMKKRKNKRSPKPGTKFGKEFGIFQGLLNQVLDNLQVSIKNIHIRYEDSNAVPGNVISCGFTLDSLTVNTADFNWRPTLKVVNRKKQKVIHKLVYTSKVAVYFNQADPYPLRGRSPNMLYKGMWRLITRSSDGLLSVEDLWKKGPGTCSYLVKPIDVRMELTHNADKKPGRPIFQVCVNVSLIHIEMTVELFDRIVAVRNNMRSLGNFQVHALYRPKVNPNHPDGIYKSNCRLWWQYAINAIIRNNRQEDDTRLDLNQLKVRQLYIDLYKRTLRREAHWTEKLEDYELMQLDELETNLPVPALAILRYMTLKEIEQEKHQNKAMQRAESVYSTGSGGLLRFRDDRPLEELFKTEDVDYQGGAVGPVFPKDMVLVEFKMSSINTYITFADHGRPLMDFFVGLAIYLDVNTKDCEKNEPWKGVMEFAVTSIEVRDFYTPNATIKKLCAVLPLPSKKVEEKQAPEDNLILSLKESTERLQMSAHSFKERGLMPSQSVKGDVQGSKILEDSSFQKEEKEEEAEEEVQLPFIQATVSFTSSSIHASADMQPLLIVLNREILVKMFEEFYERLTSDASKRHVESTSEMAARMLVTSYKKSTFALTSRNIKLGCIQLPKIYMPVNSQDSSQGFIYIDSGTLTGEGGTDLNEDSTQDHPAFRFQLRDTKVCITDGFAFNSSNYPDRLREFEEKDYMLHPLVIQIETNTKSPAIAELEEFNPKGVILLSFPESLTASISEQKLETIVHMMQRTQTDFPAQKGPLRIISFQELMRRLTTSDAPEIIKPNGSFTSLEELVDFEEENDAKDNTCFSILRETTKAIKVCLSSATFRLMDNHNGNNQLLYNLSLSDLEVVVRQRSHDQIIKVRLPLCQLQDVGKKKILVLEGLPEEQKPALFVQMMKFAGQSSPDYTGHEIKLSLQIHNISMEAGAQQLLPLTGILHAKKRIIKTMMNKGNVPPHIYLNLNVDKFEFQVMHSWPLKPIISVVVLEPKIEVSVLMPHFIDLKANVSQFGVYDLWQHSLSSMDASRTSTPPYFVRLGDDLESAISAEIKLTLGGPERAILSVAQMRVNAVSSTMKELYVTGEAFKRVKAELTKDPFPGKPNLPPRWFPEKHRDLDFEAKVNLHGIIVEVDIAELGLLRALDLPEELEGIGNDEGAPIALPVAAPPAPPGAKYNSFKADVLVEEVKILVLRSAEHPDLLPLYSFEVPEVQLKYPQVEPGHFSLKASYFNREVMLWEPLVEEWTPSIHVENTDEKGCEILISTNQTMMVNVTSELLDSAHEALSLVYPTDEEVEKRKVTRSYKDFEFVNDSGLDLSVTFNTKDAEGTPRKVSSGKSIFVDDLEKLQSASLSVEGEWGQGRSSLASLPLWHQGSVAQVHRLLSQGSWQDLLPLEEHAWQYQRFHLLLGGRWMKPFIPFVDKGEWMCRQNKEPRIKEEIDNQLAPGWSWIDNWHVDQSNWEEGWEYAADFPEFTHKYTPRGKRERDQVRRRCWVRTKAPDKKGNQPKGEQPLNIAWLVNVTPQGTCRIKARSTVVIHNLTSLELNVQATGRQWAGLSESVGKVAGKSKLFVPVPLADAEIYKYQLSSSNAKTWSEAVIILNKSHLTSSTQNINLTAGNGGKVFLVSKLEVKNNLAVLKLLSNYKLRNLLPCKVSFSATAGAGIEEGALEPGDHSFISTLNPTNAGTMTITVESGETKLISSPMSITDVSMKDVSKGLMKVLDLKSKSGDSFQLQANFSMDTDLNIFCIALSCPFWVIDRSGLALQLGLHQKVAVTPRVNDLCMYYSPQNQIAFGLGSEAKPKIWTTSIKLQPAVTSTRITVPDPMNKKYYPLTVLTKSCPSPFNKTTLVEVFPTFTVINGTDHTIDVCQKGCVDDDQMLTIQSGCKSIFSWTKPNKNLQILARFSSETEWVCEGFDLTNETSVTTLLKNVDGLESKSEDPEYQVLHVDIRKGAAKEVSDMVIVFWQAIALDQHGARVVNESNTDLVITQIGCPVWWPVPMNAGSSMEVGWPLHSHKNKQICIELPNGQVLAKISPKTLNKRHTLKAKTRDGDEVKLSAHTSVNGITNLVTISEFVEKPPSIVSKPGFTAGVHVKLKAIGFSFISNDNLRWEILLMTLSDIEILASLNAQRKEVTLIVDNVQMDNFVPKSTFPVLFGKTKPRDDSAAALPFLKVTALQSCKTSTSKHLQTADMQLAPFYVQMDWATVEALKSFSEPALKLKSDVFSASRNPRLWVKQLSKPPSATVDITSSMQLKRLFIENLDISDIIMHVGFQKASLPSASRRKVGVTDGIIDMASTISPTRIHVGKLHRENLLREPKGLAKELGLHYFTQLTSPLLNLIGSYVVGRPAHLINSIGSGVADLVVQPAAGCKTGGMGGCLSGVGKGSLSLCRNLTHGVCGTVASVGDCTVGTASLLTCDGNYIAQRNRNRQFQIASGEGVSHALVRSRQNAIGGFVEGWNSLTGSAIEQANQRGTTGCLAGSAQGLVGIAVKPVLGIGEAVVDITQGIANSTGENRSSTERSRPRRYLKPADSSSKTVLVPFKIEEAQKQEVVLKHASHPSGNFEQEIGLDQQAISFTTSGIQVKEFISNTNPILTKRYNQISHFVAVGQTMEIYYVDTKETTDLASSDARSFAAICARLMAHADAMKNPNMIQIIEQAEQVQWPEQPADLCQRLGLGHTFGTTFPDTPTLKGGNKQKLFGEISTMMRSEEHGNVYEALDRAMACLKQTWFAHNSGYNTRYAVLWLVLNLDDRYTIQVKNVEMSDGRHYSIIPGPKYDSASRSILPGGAVLIFAYGHRTRNLIPSTVRFVIECTGFIGTFSPRPEPNFGVKPAEGCEALILDEKVVTYWSRCVTGFKSK